MVKSIDVLIPVFNAEPTILGSLLSIMQQTFRAITILVVDDGSTDKTAAIAETMAASDPRIKLLRKENGGIVDALNYGLQHCTSDYIARHDGDDLADVGRLQAQFEFLETHPHYVAVGSDVRIIDENGAIIDDHVVAPNIDAADPTSIPSREPYIIHPFLMVRRSAINDIGGYRHVIHAEDTDLYWRLHRSGGMFNIPSVLGSYRRHSNGITSTSVRNGRISAMSSQLSAISESRRRRNRHDLIFSKTMIDAYNETNTLEDLIRLGSSGLDAEEKAFLRSAVAIKMVELASYRAWSPTASDLDFIRKNAYAHMHLASAINRREIEQTLLYKTLTYVATPDPVSAARLLPRRLYLKFGRIFSQALWSKMRRLGAAAS